MVRIPRLRWPILALIILDLALLLIFVLNPNLPFANNKSNEAAALTGQESFLELKKYFTSLANTRGGEYAYEVLKIAPIKAGTDMHLLGHVVGEVLYRQKGAEGMRYCTQDFRNACSHTIVVGLFSDKGEQAIPEIIEQCKKAPGGKGAYNMCFHGLGHGVLAYTGYDIAKTVGLCEKTKTGNPGAREYPECVGGSVMEIISGGDHDKELWTTQSKKYLGTSDPLYPCNSNLIPDEVKSICYVYLTPHLFTFAGGSHGVPQESFEKAFTYCNALDDSILRDACYGGFGKEFVVLAKARDIRNIDKMSTEELSTTYEWCSRADTPDGRRSCLWHVLGSLYWGGENTPATAVKFCALTTEERAECYGRLTTLIFHFKDRERDRKAYCEMLPEEERAKCTARV